MNINISISRARLELAAAEAERRTVAEQSLPRLDQEELLHFFLQEMAQAPAIPPLAMEHHQWFAVLGALQLARSHPEFSTVCGNAYAVVDQFAFTLDMLLSEAGPCTEEVIRRGWRGNPPVQQAEEPTRAIIIPE